MWYNINIEINKRERVKTMSEVLVEYVIGIKSDLRKGLIDQKDYDKCIEIIHEEMTWQRNFKRNFG